ncbi:MAG: hypothetical protein K2Y23_04070 [Cyanobacteria bacterium]|nr:hypothetical protein [Cyanobacteriota bacterium]
MKRLMTAVLMVVLVASGAAAQTPMGQMGKDKMAKPITVTGCVATGKDADHFVLTDAKMTGEKTGKTYDLMGGDIRAHVGHKVEVTGTLDTMAMPSKDKMAMGKEKMPMEGEHGMAKGKTAEAHSMLHVTSVKMVAATCP